MSLINSGPNLSLLDHVFLYHFHLGLSKEATFHLVISSGGSSWPKTISEGKAVLQKILKNTPYTGIFYEFPKEEVEPSPDQQEEAHTTEYEIPLNPIHDLVAEEPPTMGTQHTLEDDEPHLSMFPFEIEEDLFEDFGNASNLPIQVKPLVHSAPFEDDDGPHNDSFLLEHIKGLSAIMSHEWLAKMELSTEVA